MTKQYLHLAHNHLLTNLLNLIRLKQSINRPGQALRNSGRSGSQNSTQLAREGGEVFRPTHRPPLPSETTLVFIAISGQVDSKARVRQEGLSSSKIPMTSSGIEAATTHHAYASIVLSFEGIQSDPLTTSLGTNYKPKTTFYYKNKK